MSDTSQTKQIRLFVSYGHKDSANFVARLTASLDMYYDTFWDNKLQAGEFSPQLKEAICKCDFLLVVMSYAQSKSDSCKWELDIAYKNNREIVPIKLFDNHKDEELETLQFADFRPGFDEGFRRLTNIISGERLSSWEYLAYEDDDHLFVALQNGKIPSMIAKSIAEWAIVDRLWAYIEVWTSEFEKQYDTYIFRGIPRISTGILHQCKTMANRFGELDNWRDRDFINHVFSVVE